jgi:DNA polymerase-3 subunit gamma/tau
MEVTLLKAIEARTAVNLDTVLKQLNSLRGQGGPNTPATAAATAPSPASAPAAPNFSLKSEMAEPKPAAAQSSPIALVIPAAPPADRDELEALWARLVDAVSRASKFTGGYLINAHPVSLTKNLFTIGFDPEFDDQLSLVDHPRNHALLQTKLAELGHPNTAVKFIKAEAPAGRMPITAPPTTTSTASEQPTAKTSSTAASAKEKSASVPFNKDDFKNDPLIAKALEVFKGQIVEVRA